MSAPTQYLLGYGGTTPRPPLFSIVPGDRQTTIDRVVLGLLYTDRRAEDGDTLPSGADRRGWWADPEMGSRLWLLDRERCSEATAGRARAYVEEALEPLTESGLAQAVEVAAEVYDRTTIAIHVVVVRGDPDAASLRYEFTWQEVAT